jgi:hypothetical protein
MLKLKRAENEVWAWAPTSLDVQRIAYLRRRYERRVCSWSAFWQVGRSFFLARRMRISDECSPSIVQSADPEQPSLCNWEMVCLQHYRTLQIRKNSIAHWPKELTSQRIAAPSGFLFEVWSCASSVGRDPLAGASSPRGRYLELQFVLLTIVRGVSRHAE